MKKQFTSVIEKEGDRYVSLCLELNIASQGGSVEEAKSNLQEAVELFLECASEKEIKDRIHTQRAQRNKEELLKPLSTPRKLMSDYNSAFETIKKLVERFGVLCFPAKK